MIKNLPIRKDHDIVEIMREPLQHKFLKILHGINTNNDKDNNDDDNLGESTKKGDMRSVLTKDQTLSLFLDHFPQKGPFKLWQ